VSLPGVVLETVGGVYRTRVHGSQAEVDAFLRGRLKQQARTGDRVVAGDRVLLQTAGEGEEWVIEEVLERRNELVRAGPGGKRPKVVAANLDQVLVVVAVSNPPFQGELADRYLVLAESCGIPAALVVNKTDLLQAPDAELDALLDTYRAAGYPVLETSVVTRSGLSSLSARMEGRVSTLIGPSGAGKSSLLNALYPGLDLRTGAVSRRRGRGRHTTVSARMVVLEGDTRVIDTPGFSDVATWGIEARELARCFPEFLDLEESCRFRGCSHIHEPDCGVKAAVEEGKIHPRRYGSYRVLLQEGGREELRR